MSKKVEERALEAYPVEIVKTNFDTYEYDENVQAREIYAEGYEQAEKDMIERACRWMLDNLATYFGYGPVYQQDMINDFLKAMEEEQ